MAWVPPVIVAATATEMHWGLSAEARSGMMGPYVGMVQHVNIAIMILVIGMARHSQRAAVNQSGMTELSVGSEPLATHAKTVTLIGMERH